MGAADPSRVLSSSRSVACCFISWRVRTNLDHSSALGLAMCWNRHYPTFQNSSTFLLVLGQSVDRKKNHKPPQKKQVINCWGVIFRSGRFFFLSLVGQLFCRSWATQKPACAHSEGVKTNNIWSTKSHLSNIIDVNASHVIRNTNVMTCLMPSELVQCHISIHHNWRCGNL